jgi:hypothetical protein
VAWRTGPVLRRQTISAKGCALRCGSQRRASLTRIHHSNHMINLSYAIRKSPVHPKALKWILQAQSQMNDKATWSHEHLNLAPAASATERPGLGFPFVRIAPLRIGPYAVDEPVSTTSQVRTPNAIASGSTKTPSLWDCHLVASFLQQASEKFPEIVFELRDDTAQFVIGGAVTIQAGKLSLEGAWLRSEQERILEVTGDPQAVTGLIWAQAKALHDGVYLTDMPAADADVRELIHLDLDLDDYHGATVGELAAHFVRNILSEVVPLAA